MSDTKSYSQEIRARNNIQLLALKVPISRDFRKLGRQKPLKQIPKLQLNVMANF